MSRLKSQVRRIFKHMRLGKSFQNLSSAVKYRFERLMSTLKTKLKSVQIVSYNSLKNQDKQQRM